MLNMMTVKRKRIAFGRKHSASGGGFLCRLPLVFAISYPVLALDAGQAEQQVKAAACKDGQSVSEALDQSIKSHSQRDVGWRVFPEEGYVDVERAVLINKGKELRYRWRVSADGSLQAVSDRAQSLCAEE